MATNNNPYFDFGDLGYEPANLLKTGYDEKGNPYSMGELHPLSGEQNIPSFDFVDNTVKPSIPVAQPSTNIPVGSTFAFPQEEQEVVADQDVGMEQNVPKPNPQEVGDNLFYSMINNVKDFGGDIWGWADENTILTEPRVLASISQSLNTPEGGFVGNLGAGIGKGVESYYAREDEQAANKAEADRKKAERDALREYRDAQLALRDREVTVQEEEAEQQRQFWKFLGFEVDSPTDSDTTVDTDAPVDTNVADNIEIPVYDMKLAFTGDIRGFGKKVAAGIADKFEQEAFAETQAAIAFQKQLTTDTSALSGRKISTRGGQFAYQEYEKLAPNTGLGDASGKAASLAQINNLKQDRERLQTFLEATAAAQDVSGALVVKKELDRMDNLIERWEAPYNETWGGVNSPATDLTNYIQE